MAIPTLLLALALAPAPQEPAPAIQSIETFGLRTVPRDALLAAAGIEAGETLEDRDAVLARLRALDGVADASVAVVTVEAGTVLYLGIREDDAPPGLAYREAPTAPMALPEGILSAYQALLATLPAAVAAGQAGEEHSAGHAMMEFAPARAVQEHFVELAADHLEVLRRALREAADATHRQAATMVIAYAADKQGIVEDLVYAARDADAGVRNNAIRNLTVLADWAQQNQGEMAIDAEPFLGLLDSLEWSDRNKGLALLTMRGLTADEVPAAARDRLLTSLAEMAQWQTFGHCLPAAILLGRLAGETDLAIFGGVMQSEGDRQARAQWVEQTLEQARKLLR